MPRWRVLIRVSKRDLERLAEDTSNTEWHIEFDALVDSYVIRADRFEVLGSAAEVHTAAVALVNEVSLAAFSRWAMFSGIVVDSIYETPHESTPRQTVVVGTGYWYSEDKDHETGSIEERIALLREHPNIALALSCIRDEDTWASYKLAYEAIDESSQIVARRIVTKAECKRFTASAKHRHHKVPSPIKNPMTKAEGRVWITNVVRRLIASLLDEKLNASRGVQDGS